MIARILKPPKGSFFLLGPRGTGKSTWLESRLGGKAHFIDLLDERLYQDYLQDLSLFSGELEALPRNSWVCIDEIQRLPQLLNEVHRMIEKRGLRFALTGSSARKLRRGGVNLLGGRASKKIMYPFVPQELRGQFALEETLRFGSLPLVWDSEEKEETLEAYIQMYFKEEIQAEALVRNLPGFSRFLPIAALYHGQTLNTASLARDAGVARTTVVGYIDILADTLLAYTLPAYRGRLRVREKKHPKLYWIDSGILRAVKRQLGPIGQEEKGALFEGWIAMLLRLYGSYTKSWDDIYYWAPSDSNRLEVDFLLSRGEETVALEVKATSRLRPDHFRGLQAIESLPGLKKRILLYLGQREMITPEGIEVWPLKTFLRSLEEVSIFP